MIPLHVLYFHDNEPPCSKCVRVIEPLHYLQRRGHQITAVESLVAGDKMLSWGDLEKALQRCNIVLVANIDITDSFLDLYFRMVEHCGCNKKLMVYDTDDCYVEVPESNPHRKQTLSWDFLKRVVERAHVVTVTGKVLQKVLSFYHQHIFILPNMIDFAKYRPRPRNHDRLRIGWAGGMTHVPDVALVTDAIRELQKKYRFDFVILGFANEFKKITEVIRNHNISPAEMKEPFHQDMVALAHHLRDIDYELIQTAPYTDFPAVLSALDLDIGLCPIQPTLFNRCRSAIKFYQYAAVQTVTVASDIYPYSEEPAILVKNTPDSWREALEALIGSKKEREQAARIQYDYVWNNRNYETNGIVWDVLYQQCLEHVQ